MRKIPDEIAIAVSDWIDENVPTPDGPPVVNATVKLEAVDSRLIGSMPDGSGGPTSGTRTHVIRIKFFAHPDTPAAAIDQLLGGLRMAAAEEPQIAGLNGGRLSLDSDEKVEAENQDEDSYPNGQIVTVTARVAVSEG